MSAEHEATIRDMRTSFRMLEAVASKAYELTPEAVTTGDDDVAACAEINSLRRLLAGVAALVAVGTSHASGGAAA